MNMLGIHGFAFNYMHLLCIVLMDPYVSPIILYVSNLQK